MVSNEILHPCDEGQYVIRTDPHCHILPGLDDGSANMEMSLKMARRMVKAGIKNAVATPHGIHPGITTNVDPDFLREQVAKLNSALSREEIDLAVYPGTEVFLRGRVIDAFEQGQLITWADQGKYILVELGFQRRSDSVMDVVDYFLARGIVPIIAHPERYLWLPGDIDTFMELRSRGCIFQFNVMSINGHFNKQMQEVALRLMPYSGRFLIGTDSHSDAEKYFDFADVKQKLEKLGLIGDDGMVLPGERQGAPDMDDLK